MIEEWREAFPGSCYFVSNLGRVKSKERSWTYKKKGKNITRNAKERFLSTPDRGSGYLCVRLQKNGKGVTFSIHRLVASLFVERAKGKDCVNHIDGDKKNNNASNLEWCTQKENVSHAQETGLWRARKFKSETGVYLYFEKERSIFRAFYLIGKKRKYIKQSTDRDIVDRAILKHRENL